jgi:translation elongation factor P/translation initiation factor 5A
MKPITIKPTILALLPAALLASSSCSTEPKYQGVGIEVIQPGEAGGVRVKTYKETATVTGIDKATRKVTLVTKDGTKSTVKCGPDVANFAQIEVGDQVKAAVTEQLVVFVRRPGEPSGDGAAGVVALAPIGAKPGGVIANTEEITAKVKAIDLKHRKATLLFPDGTSHTFTVRPDVDMTKHAVGDEVVFSTTEAVAISVEKP